MSTLCRLLLVSITSAAVIADLKNQKITNEIIVLGWVCGFVIQAYDEGVRGCFNFFIGAIVPVMILIGLFYFRMLGAGDIKLFSIIGGLVGSSGVITCICYSFLFGAIISGYVLVRYCNPKARLQYFQEYIATCIESKKVKRYTKEGMRLEHIHFTVPILMAVLLYIGGVI